MVTSSSRIVWIVVGITLCIALYCGYASRVTIAAWWWHTTHTLPEVVLFLTQDAQLGGEMGDYYFDEGYEQTTYDINRADRLFARAITYDEQYPWLWFQRARIAFLRGEYDTARRYLDAEQQLPNAMSRAWYLRGLVEGFAGNQEAALEAFKTYYTYDNKSWYIHNNLAWTYFQLGQYQDMDLISVVGLSRYPDNPWLLMSRGIAQYNLGNYARAQNFLERAEAVTKTMDATIWSNTYPGNDPQVAAQGWNEFRTLLQENLNLVHSALQGLPGSEI